MNAKDRFRAICSFEPCDRTLMYEMGYWVAAVRRWYGEGLEEVDGIPDDFQGSDLVVQSFFQRDKRYWRRTFQKVAMIRDVDLAVNLDHAFGTVPINLWLVPPFNVQWSDETEDTRVIRDEYGITLRMWKDNRGMPQWLDYPVKTRNDFESIKERLIPKMESRLPENWAECLVRWKDREYPLCLAGWPCGFYGSLRQLLGDERLFYLFYDQPDWIKEIVIFLADFWIELLDQVMSDLRPLGIERYDIWEDMAYKGGAMISNEMFVEFLMPGYKKLTRFLRESGIDVILVDSDGDVSDLIPLWIEAGVNGIYPIEVAANMDVVELREKYPKLLLFGGIDKRAVAKGHDSIEQELEYRLSRVLPTGGYIPFLDHFAPPDVSWEDYRFFRQRIYELAQKYGCGTCS
jgi:hypothetical protein